MQIIEVADKKTAKEFIQFPVGLYKNEPHWIRPLDKDVEEVFHPKTNKFFRHGECTRWVMKDEGGKVIGRVAAFVNKKGFKSKNSQGQELCVGGMGFFEAINDKAVAFKLFDTCKEWLESKGANAMEGPINFGERDNWWGLLVEGFEIDPNYKMPYNFPHYQEWFEEYGFQTYFKQLTFGRGVNDPLEEKYYDKAARIAKDPKYVFKQLDPKQIEKFTEDFRTIYNQAWVKHSGVGEMSTLQAKNIMKQMKPIIDPDVVFFAYYDGEPVAFFFNLPEVNQVIRYLNGKLDWIGKLKFLYHKLMRTNKKMVGRGFGVVPAHQGKGLEGAIVMFSREIVQEKIRGRYLEYEMNWIGDFNPKMVKVAASIGRVIKTHVTYRKLFDDSIVFERCPEIR